MRNEKTLGLVLTSLFTAIIVIMAFTPLGYIPLVVINATIIHIPVILGALFCGPKRGAFLGFVFGLTSFIKNTVMPASLSAFVFSPVLAVSVAGTAGIFKSAFICFVPRILVGIIPYFVYKLVMKAAASQQKKLLGLLLNAVVGIFAFAGIYAFLNKILEGRLGTGIFAAIAAVISVLLFALLQVVYKKKDSAILAFTYGAISGALTNTLLVMGGIFVLYRDAYGKALGTTGDAVLGIIGGVISFNGVIEAIVAAVIVASVGMVLKKIRPIQ